MNTMYMMGYEDATNYRERRYEDGPVGIVGVAIFDYNQGYKSGNRDNIWRNNNRPPLADDHKRVL